MNTGGKVVAMILKAYDKLRDPGIITYSLVEDAFQGQNIV